MFGGIMLYEWQTEDAGGSHGSSTSNEITASLAAFLNGKETKKLYVSHEKKIQLESQLTAGSCLS